MIASELTDLILSTHETSHKSLISKIESAIEYSERYQNKPKGYYQTHHFPPKTQEAISLLVKILTGIIADDSIWNDIHALLRFTV